MDEKNIKNEMIKDINEGLLSDIEKAAEKGARKAGRCRGIISIIGICCLLWMVFLIWGSVAEVSNKITEIFSFDSGISEHDYAIEDKGIFGYTAADFEDAIIVNSQKEKKIEVYSVDVSEIATATKTGLFNWAVFSKCQSIKYCGNVVYTVDLGVLQSNCIDYDNENGIVTLKIPHPEQGNINILPEKMEYFDVEKGLLSFGEIKLTPQQNADLETEARAKMQEVIENNNYQDNADRFAKLVLWEIYSPIVKSVDKACSLEVIFDD